MFVDSVKVLVSAGDGGNGLVNFRREKYVEKGGPDGGDGGNGGDVVVVASSNEDTLATYRFKRLLQAGNGQKGDQRKKHGRNGDDLILQVPVGTTVTGPSGEVLVDLVEAGQRAIIAKGGKGGYGNAHFTSSVRQAPRVAEKGEPGESFETTLELKMIADVGLVGLPNAGKSTLLASVSNARPEIADYPFTTLKPNLGVVDLGKNQSLLMADVPGLIAGAAQGKGLGDEFLRHLERTTVLVHLIDSYSQDVAADYRTIQQELKDYQIDLSQKPQVVVLTKIDGRDVAELKAQEKKLRKVLPKSTSLYTISALSKTNLKELLFELEKMAKKAKSSGKVKKILPRLSLRPQADDWRIEKATKGWNVSGGSVERFAIRTDFENPHGVRRLRDILRKKGVLKELEKQGIEPGEVITIGGNDEHRLEY